MACWTFIVHVEIKHSEEKEFAMSDRPEFVEGESLTVKGTLKPLNLADKWFPNWVVQSLPMRVLNATLIVTSNKVGNYLKTQVSNVKLSHVNVKGNGYDKKSQNKPWNQPSILNRAKMILEDA